jgi:hypothetical protein
MCCSIDIFNDANERSWSWLIHSLVFAEICVDLMGKFREPLGLSSSVGLVRHKLLGVVEVSGDLADVDVLESTWCLT